MIVVNPRRSQGYSTFVYLLSHISSRPENAVMYSAGNEGVKICGDLPETTAFKSYAANDLPAVSFLSAKRQRVPNDCQQHSTLPKNDAY